MESVPMALPSPPQELVRPLLPCVQFLNTHFSHSGMDKYGYDLLYRMIEMMSAVGYEAGVAFSLTSGSVSSSEAAIALYLQCIQDGIDSLKETILQPWRKARRATRSLPELDEHDGMLENKWRQWYWKLRTLHEPTGNDTRLFSLVKWHFYHEVYERLNQLHLAKPYLGFADVAQKAAKLYLSLEQLESIAREADAMVRALDDRFRVVRQNMRASGKYRRIPEHAIVLSPELLMPDVYVSPDVTRPTRSNPLFSKSFGSAEEELMRRGHARASTFTETDYTTSDVRTGLAQESPDLPSIGVAKRRGVTNVLRVFTGSFSQLEDDIRRLRIDKVKTPETPSIQGSSDPVRVRDFAPTPAISPCTTPSPIALQRREAVVSRDAESQDRVINGEVVKNRRPSNKERARTIDDTTGGLEAWLREVSRERRSPRPTGSGAFHRHREHTL